MRSPFDSDSEEPEASILKEDYYQKQQVPTETAQKKCCAIGRIEITSAEEVTEAGKQFTQYTIVVNEKQVQRRYSDFESLRKILKRLYPHLIVPPIPEKHSFVSHLVKANKDRELEMIQSRKKLLLSFIRKLNEHPIICQEHIFHRFLEPGTWADVLYSSNISSSGGGGGQVQQAVDKKVTAAKDKISAKVGAAKKLREPDLKFLAHEEAAQKFVESMSQMEKTHRRVAKKVADLVAAYNEMGLVLNGVALNCSSSKDEADVALSSILEMLGGSFDSLHDCSAVTCTGMEDLSLSLHEYYQLSLVVNDLLKARHLKHAQLEELGDQLDAKRAQLANLERGSATTATNGGFFGQLGDKLHQLVDQNPETTRRNNIAKVNDMIGTLEKALEEADKELKQYNELISQELVRFQSVKTIELTVIMERYSKLHQQMFDKFGVIWQQALKNTEAI